MVDLGQHLHRSQGQIALAAEEEEASARAAQQSGSPEREAWAYSALGYLSCWEGLPNQAAHYCAVSGQYFEETRSALGRCLFAELDGLIRRQHGDLSGAVACFIVSEHIARTEVRDDDQVATARMLRADALRA